VKSIAAACTVVALLAVSPLAQAQDAVVHTQHRLDGTPKRYVLVPSRKQDPAQYRQCTTLLQRELDARGWKEAAFESADVAIFVQYAPTPTSGAERALHIEMFAAKPFMQDMSMVPVYDATVRPAGPAGLPDLMKAAFEQFPGTPGQRTVSLAAQ
jgi:hypothetical protein